MRLLQHKCIEKMNAALSKHNSELEIMTTFAENNSLADRLVIGTVKLDASKRGKKTSVVASFCPFCGENLENAGEAKKDE